MRLWRALEAVPGWAGVRSVWRDALGPEIDFLGPLLEPMETLAISVPLGASEHHRIVMHSDDDIVAVCPNTGDVVPLDHDDIVIYRLCAELLLGRIASALALSGEPTPVESGRRLWWLGEFVPMAGVRFPVYLVRACDAEEVLSSAGHVTALTTAPPVLVTPTRASCGPALESLVTARRIGWCTLEDLLAWDGEAAFRTICPLREALRPFLATHAPRTIGEHDQPRFPTPAGSVWSDLMIRFKDAHTVSVSIHGESRVLTYADMGMVNKKSRNPTVQWDLLYAFAQAHGLLTWSSPAAARENQKRRERLADNLQRFFGIEEDPFEPRDGGWLARFTVEPD
jgi:hypothetical protein